MKTRAPAPRRRQSGFALLITITLLAFLVLLLVSLAALTKVETQVATNSQQLSQARQNALMALNVALGQLQMTLGPDQRVSAPASQRGDGVADYAAVDADNNANWIGVYRQNPDPAVTTRDPQLLNWLVSGNQNTTVSATTAGAPVIVPNTIVTGLSKDMTVATPVKVGGNDAVLLVGPASTLAEPLASAPASVVDRFVVAPLEKIQVPSGTLPGFDPSSSTPTTIGNFAYWVGDEGVKAKVSVTDPWLNPVKETLDATTPQTTPDQALSYSFINAQRFGIEAIEDSAGTPLNTAYPATSADTQTRDGFKATLPRILALAQLPLANAAGQAALTSAAKVRFHDLTAHSRSLLTDTANGGLKKDLTAWLADPSAPSNPVSNAASDDYITPGDTADTTKYGLPKWGMIRSYADTRDTKTALPPRQQTPTTQGIHPVVTYARMGFNISCTQANSKPKLHLMPVVALWNPNNVAIDKNTTYEVCFAFVCYSPQANPSIPWETNNTLNVGINMTGATLAGDYFYINRIQNHATHYGTGTGTDTEFYRFKLVLSSDLGAGESRLFTIKENPGMEPYTDGTVYSSGNSIMTDAIVADDNSVYIPKEVSYTTVHLTNSLNVYTLPEKPSHTRLEVLLTPPLSGVSTTNIPVVNAWLRSNAYQRILGSAFQFVHDAYSVMVPVQNTRDPFIYYRIELMMSDIETTYPQSRAMGKDYDTAGIPGAPRWLAVLNPQASISLRKPFEEASGTTRSGFNPSYLTEHYAKSGSTILHYIRHDLPNAAAGTTNVSAGTQVSVTAGQAQNLVVREFLPADAPLFSLAQLQHVNVSTLNLNPAYAIGNSLANLYVNRDDPDARSPVLPTDSFAITTPDTAFPDANTFRRIYDLSYLLNKSLWDGYYFSTIPRNLDLAAARNTNYHLPNNRHRFHWETGTPTQQEVDDLLGIDPSASRLKLDAPAAHLLINGGFNVNSTSEQAWRALLYSHNGVATDPAGDPADPKQHPYSRFASPTTSGTQPNHTWLGYRILSDSEIHDLAKKIVGEVQTRGPFLSLADFVNRRLVNDDTGIKGSLQSAIDKSTVNQKAPFNYETTPPSSPPSGNTVYAAKLYPRDIDLPHADAPQKINYMGGSDAEDIAASRAAFAPGYLTQADLLNSIGPGLTARSDTFRIRTYGDTVNPVTGEVSGRAWCEAMVQRLPDYVVPASAGGDASSIHPPAHPANSTFGRRFKVISFRWLSSDDI